MNVNAIHLGIIEIETFLLTLLRLPWERGERRIILLAPLISKESPAQFPSEDPLGLSRSRQDWLGVESEEPLDLVFDSEEGADWRIFLGGGEEEFDSTCLVRRRERDDEESPELDDSSRR